MKIHDTSHIPRPAQSKSKQPSKDTNGPTFGETLKDALAPAPAETETAAKSTSPAQISRMQFDATLAAQPKVTLAARVDHFLDLLETYQKGLTDPGADMKTLAPLMDRIDSERLALNKELQQLADGHPLKSILNQALVEAAKETVHFHSGSYVDK